MAALVGAGGACRPVVCQDGRREKPGETAGRGKPALRRPLTAASSLCGASATNPPGRRPTRHHIPDHLPSAQRGRPPRRRTPHLPAACPGDWLSHRLTYAPVGGWRSDSARPGKLSSPASVRTRRNPCSSRALIPSPRWMEMGVFIPRHFLGSVLAITDANPSPLLLSQIRHLLLADGDAEPALQGQRPALAPRLLYEVLLRVPAKDLCRFRAVCRPWRSLLSDPHFVAAHAARHPGPLIVADHGTDRSAAGPLLDIMDLSGRVIKRVVAPGSFWAARMEYVTTAQIDGVCVLIGNSTRLPGEYKVLRLRHSYFHQEQLCEVVTLDGSSHARWRGKKAPPDCVDPDHWSRLTINGIVYFLSRERVRVREENAVPVRLALFDLETEDP
ncbi:hypothetical protein C2845_PM04G05180 [Panicum miliaceum]|uniref:F-box domain-containing protein n=1 Tax=Panicum miliaceum TaxID=4540 RepID=A0A3L6QN28_PANMI|nr:hypothetical protein C2845_PM04G05180 [Panicum miliaceum]